jgi:hypothetical protein
MNPEKGQFEIEPTAEKPSYLMMSELEKAAEKHGATLPEIINAVRADWLSGLPSQEDLDKFPPEERSRIVTKEELKKVCEAAGIQLPVLNPELSAEAANLGIDQNKWQDRSFQGRFRFHLSPGSIEGFQHRKNRELFFKLFGKKYKGREAEIIDTLKGYDLSIRPMNFSPAIANSEAIENFLPEVGQKFEDDPFGVQRREHLVLDEEDGKLIYLSTRKKEHGTYLAILRSVAYCSAGCSSCYRGHQTRELEKFKAINPDGTETDVYFPPPVEQIERLVKKWNQEKNPPEDILFSGGEPMDISIEEWQKIFETLKGAEHLKFLRICTGDLFLGEPFRISDPKFLDLLKEWHEETGKPIKFATNLPHPAFVTPEAVHAIMSLHKLGIGIEIQTQTALEEGILCFQKEIEQKIQQLGKERLTDEELIEAWAPALAKSFKLLKELCIKVAMVSDRPYKFIHDMQKSVSVVYNTVLFSLLSEPHVGTTDSAVRPTSFAVFTPKLPNLNMDFHGLEYLAKVDGAYQDDDEEVKMQIPHAVGETLEYREPKWQGINDKETLQRITDIAFWKKLRERVKELVEGN